MSEEDTSVEGEWLRTKIYAQTNSGYRKVLFTIVTRLLDRLPKNRGSIPGKNRNLSPKCPDPFSSQPILPSYSYQEGKGRDSMYSEVVLSSNTGNFNFIFTGNVRILEYYVYR